MSTRDLVHGDRSNESRTNRSVDNSSRRDFFSRGGIAVLSALAFRGNSRARQKTQSLTLYIGTYTSGKSKGIYIYTVNAHSGELKYENTVEGVIDPSFLAIDRERRFLYAVNELDQFEGKPSGALSAFSIDRKTGDLHLLNQQPSLGGSPCHLILDATGSFLLVANYGGGNVSVFPVRSDGSLGSAIEMVQHHGSGANEERQSAPHAHCIVLDRSNRYAFVADLGLDKIMIYDFDAKAGKLKPARQPWAQLKPGAGPRHFVFDRNGRYAYVINELDSTLTAFKYEAASGTLQAMQTVSTLPIGFSGNNSCAELLVSPSGRFLYGSNRGHDSIVVFAINQSTGKLTYVEHASTQGKTPRNFTIDPNGRFLFVANQQSNTIVTLRIDTATGRLQPTGLVAEVPTPVCLTFS
jgi:6-phosphogluconolactonase